jgi:cytochrome P450
MRANMNHENIALWRWFFESTGRVNATTSEARPLGERFLFTVEPENIKAILATQFQDYGKGEPFHLVWKEFLGDSIFTTDLDQWHASRQLIRPQFIKDRVSDINVFERHFQILANSMANGGVVGMPGVATDGRGVGRKVDAADLFFRYSLDVATEFLLGNSVGSLETADQPFAQAFGEVQRVQSILARAGYVFSLEINMYHILTEFTAPLEELFPERHSGKASR